MRHTTRGYTLHSHVTVTRHIHNTSPAKQWEPSAQSHHQIYKSITRAAHSTSTNCPTLEPRPVDISEPSWELCVLEALSRVGMSVGAMSLQLTVLETVSPTPHTDMHSSTFHIHSLTSCSSAASSRALPPLNQNPLCVVPAPGRALRGASLVGLKDVRHGTLSPSPTSPASIYLLTHAHDTHTHARTHSNMHTQSGKTRP